MDSELDLSGIEIYVGAPVEVASEREIFLALVKMIGEARMQAIVFANFNVGRRQLDFLVATDSQTLVIEAKHFARRVRGGVNGTWEMDLPGGASKGVGNPYLQALEAKNALRDALRERGFELEGYPNACVAIAPGIPKNSLLPPSDFKVAITDTQGLLPVLGHASSLVLSQQLWRRFAQTIQLRRVATLDEALDPALTRWEDLVRGYRAEFDRLYATDAALLKNDTYLLGDDRVGAREVAMRAGVNGDDLLIVGPSGCGKSLLAKSIAVQGLCQGQVPVFLQAKYFTGRLQELIQREVGLLGDCSAKDLIRGAQATGLQLLLILDGYNECSVDAQLALTRSLAAAARRLGCRLAITTQLGIKRPDLITVVPVTVSRPSEELKAAISGASCGEGTEHLRDLLASVSSGFEADLVGQVGESLAEGAGRFALFDAYARQRLGADEFDGVRLLAAVAKHLIDRVSFSLSVRELDRLAATEGLSGEVLRRVLATDMMVRRTDRVSFRHELIQCAFVAEFVARSSYDDVDKALGLLDAPIYRNARSLILGAYDNDEFVERILSATADADLLERAAAGECGRAARAWVSSRCGEIVEKLAVEASKLEFSIGEGRWGPAGACEESALHWAPSERATMPSICDELRRGARIDDVLKAVAAMDCSLERAFRALEVVPGISRGRLRDGLFADAYVFGRNIGMAHLFRSVSNGIRTFRGSDVEPDEDAACRWASAKTPGQLYLMLTLARFSGDSAAFVPLVLPLMAEGWSSLPYHLQLEVLNFASLVRPSSEVERQELACALDALLPSLNPVFSGMVLEALERLGLLEEQSFQHAEAVKAEVQALLCAPESAENCQLAWSVYLGQFDHPFSSRYCEVVGDLSRDDSKRLLEMACLGAGRADLFLAPLIQELAKFNDRSVAPAIAKWLGLPEIDSLMPQEAVSAFVWSHAAMGMLGVERPENPTTAHSNAGIALASLGDLYYWIHREDLGPQEIEDKCRPALEALLDLNQTGAASALCMVVHSMSYEADTRESVLRRFPREMAAICRRCLLRPAQQVGYFPHFQHDRLGVLRFSINLLGYGGDVQDLRLLRELSRDVELGESAISAIRLIESGAVQ